MRIRGKIIRPKAVFRHPSSLFATLVYNRLRLGIHIGEVHIRGAAAALLGGEARRGGGAAK